MLNKKQKIVSFYALALIFIFFAKLGEYGIANNSTLVSVAGPVLLVSALFYDLNTSLGNTKRNSNTRVESSLDRLRVFSVLVGIIIGWMIANAAIKPPASYDEFWDIPKAPIVLFFPFLLLILVSLYIRRSLR